MTDWYEYLAQDLGFDWETSQPGLVDTLFSSSDQAGLYRLDDMAEIQAGAYIAPDPVTGNAVIEISLKERTDLINYDDVTIDPSRVSTNGDDSISYEIPLSNDRTFYRVTVD